MKCYPTIVWPEAPTFEPEAKVRAAMLAWTALENLTGLDLTSCPITVRPCTRTCWASSGSYYSAPLTGSGLFVSPYSWSWINAAGRWGRPSSTEIYLPGPVARIDSVIIDGITLDPSSYFLEDGTLRRTDGSEWPTCQDMDASAPSFTITYVRGSLPDALLIYAAQVLAIEFASAMVGDSRCRLPSNVRSVTRQGISYELAVGTFADGVTGISEVDVIIRQYNPYGLASAPVVASVDSPRRARSNARI